MSFWHDLLDFLEKIFSHPTDPEPEPEPEPEPPCPPGLSMPWCHEVDQVCSEPASPCKHNPTSDPCHEEEAPPCPTPTPPEPVPGLLEGTPQAGVYWYTPNRKADATPKICNPKRCDLFPPYEGRYCCPVVPDDDPRRGALEEALMGGPKPIWELEVTEGNLWLQDSDWFGIVGGVGKGRLRWHFPNGKAVSDWLLVDRS